MEKIKSGDLLRCNTQTFSITFNKIYLCLEVFKDNLEKNTVFVINDKNEIDFWYIEYFEKVS